MKKFWQNERKDWLIVSCFVLLGLALRLWRWPDYLVFDYEKARDALVSLAIYQEKKLTLIGPTTEVEGIFQGPLYYYLVGFFYWVLGGDPRGSSIISFLFNLACIPTLYLIAKGLFNKTVGFLAAFLSAVSFEAVSYAFWLSNPGLSVPFLFLMFYFLYRFARRGEGKFLAASLFCLGMSIQFQILNLVFLPALFLLLLFTRQKFFWKNILCGLVAFILPLCSFIFFDLRHQFLMTKSFWEKMVLVHWQKGGDGFIFSFKTYPGRLASEMANIFWPTHHFVGLVILILILGTILWQMWRTRKFVWLFLLIWLFSTFPVFLFDSRMSQSHAAFIGVSGAAILTLAYLLEKLFARIKLLAFFCCLAMLVSNFYAVSCYLPNPQKRLFDFFQGLYLKTNLELIDYTYQEAGGTNFKVDTVTAPLFISPLWDYLYSWRGKTKYGYLPDREKETKLGFLIIEPQLGSAEVYKKMAIDKADRGGMMVDARYFGQVVVQKRILK